ncbi:hypothetical protein ACIGZH_37680 [Streptomyces sp. NPDC058319]|uniref:hypothetical protein n=1 Tax=unclassified Streptomyces TaxID=2593676 RepID=UPI0036EE5445
MTRFNMIDLTGRPASRRPPARPPLPRRRSAPGPGPDGGPAPRPALTLVPGRDPYRSPVELRTLVRASMPEDVRGALVTTVRKAPGRTFQVRWTTLDDPARVPAGRVRLSWTPAADGRTDVSAHLGLPGAEVLLAVWPALRGDWCDVVRPTVAEVTELHAALSLATAALDHLVR